MAQVNDTIRWQKNLMIVRRTVEQADDVHTNKSLYQRLADMTEKSHTNRKRKKFPWLAILILVTIVSYYGYDDRLTQSLLPAVNGWEQNVITTTAKQDSVHDAGLQAQHNNTIVYLPPQQTVEQLPLPASSSVISHTVSVADIQPPVAQ